MNNFDYWFGFCCGVLAGFIFIVAMSVIGVI